MSARRVLGGLGIVGALGYGSYFAVQQKEISKYEKEVSDLQALVVKEKKAANSNQQLIKEHEERIQTLSKQESSLTADVKRTEDKLEAARQEVARLEAEVTKKSEILSKAQAEVKSANSRLVHLRGESERIREAMTLGEKSLAVAKQKSAEARQLLNPLNHPAIQGKLGSSPSKR